MVTGRECDVCGRAAGDGVDLPGWCPRCRGRFVADVADLPQLWRDLGAVLAPGAGGEQEKITGSRTPPLPLRVNAFNLRGPASVFGLPGPDQVSVPSIASVLATCRLAIRTLCDLPAEVHGAERLTVAAQVERDARFVTAWVDRYAEAVPAGGLRAIVGLVHDCRQTAWHACGYGAHKVLLGPCPTDVDQGATCARQLWIDPVLDDSVTCRDCGTRWDRRHFLWLRLRAGTLGA